MTGALQTAQEQAFIAEVMSRHARAVEQLGPGGLGPWREVLDDVPRLMALAERGVLDRALIQQHAGHTERAARVRNLHDLVELAGGQLICAHCTTPGRPVEFPCPTILALDS